MGEVYRATDSNLKRSVAIKVLPAAVAGDADRLTRFQREAEVLAALNHPNIAAIYGLEKTADFTALVMELVEGEDLSALIDRRYPEAESGSSRLLSDALPIAKQIADALEAAHEQGIVHRDLKPANIKVRADGTVKVLDFGLAKAMDPPGASSTDAMNSPTLTARATQMGMILGTAAYMAPEQARGKPVDKRADIWAFGVVLYEMLTGRRAFPGDEISDVLAAVLRQDIDWSALPEDTPPRLRRLLERCLDRDVKSRLRDIGEARVVLATIASGAPDTSSVTTPPASAQPRRWREALAWTIAAAAVIAVATLSFTRQPPTSGASRLVSLPFVPPADASLAEINHAVISPDGQKLLFSARSPNGRRQLWLRSLDSPEVTALPDTDDAIEPFWSPDSKSVAFGAQGKLRRLDIGDTRARVITDAARSNNGTWNRDGVIVFSPDYRTSLRKVKATGGEPTVTSPEGDHRYPCFLPDGRHFLFSQGQRVAVGSIDDPTMRKFVLEDSTGGAVYAAPGVLLYVRNGKVVAQPFDAGTLELSGQPTPIAAASATAPWSSARVSVSEAGVLAVQSPLGYDYQLAWFDRTGKPDGLLGPARHQVTVSESPRVSPDGRHVVVQRAEARNVVSGRDLWIGDLARGTFDRLTASENFQQLPVWSYDSREIFCVTNRQGGVGGIYSVPINGGEKTLLLAGTLFPSDVTPDGKWLVYMQRGGTTRNDIWVLPLADGRAGGDPHVVVNSPYEDVHARVSPNGRWMAYSSDVSGVNEIYVRSLTPAGQVGEPIRVSTGGGSRPAWARDGRELYYTAPISGDVRVEMVAVPVRTGGAAFEFDAAVPRFKVAIPEAAVPVVSDYDLTPDGRFLVGTGTPDTRTPPATIIFNWREALKK